MKRDLTALIAGPIKGIERAYLDGSVTLDDVFASIVQKAAELQGANIWITPPTQALVEPFVDALKATKPQDKPLWGIPFAIKDNIDLAGVPTTAACPEFAYVPEQSATAVQRLIDAGAVPVGKTNLDQFATGLVGTRSPHGPTTHPERPDHISGGSSSGSAVAVSTGLASFALGTDTAGSGRVPAAFNNLIGLKPTRGLVSNFGVVPACKTIDCVSVFTRCVSDAARIANHVVAEDIRDPYSRKNPWPNHFAHFGIWQNRMSLSVVPPEQLEFFGDASFAAAYARTLDDLAAAGIDLLPIDFRPFLDAAQELYDGPWVTERYLSVEPILASAPEAVMPVTRTIIEQGASEAATAVFRSQYKLAALRAECLQQLAPTDALLTPTAGRHYTLAEVAQDPYRTNSNLGRYTNFMNLLDLCGVALPGRPTPAGAPFGLTLAADRFEDTRLLSVAARIEQILGTSTAAAERCYVRQDTIDVVVCGAHMTGLPLNVQLTERGGALIERTQTAPSYRLYALAGGPPSRPGMIKDPGGGRSIDVEVWRLPASTFASFVQSIPWPLAMGKVELLDRHQLTGFTCGSEGLEGAVEITRFGGWRQYLSQLR